jgi:tRNA(Ile)-lysidine synthase
MASSRKPATAKRLARGARIAVGLSGGVDSVVLLHQLKQLPVRLSAVHVHHGLSPHADAWARFCTRLCRQFDVPLQIVKVKVVRKGKGLEAAARDARYRAFSRSAAPVIALAHNLDDQAETVLMNLLRGTGPRGASGMPGRSRRGGKTLWRPLLDTPRSRILAYARRHKLDWVEDESNGDEALTRNFLRRRVGPLLAKKFPRWKEALGRASRHMAAREAGRQDLLRKFLEAQGLRAPSEAKLVDMLKQLTSGGARTAIAHDGKVLRVYRDRVSVSRATGRGDFSPLTWKGESRLQLPALGGELRFRKVKGRGIAAAHRPLSVRLRSGGERLQPDARRPRRTLKNLFQEAGVPPWRRERLPLLYKGADLVWVPGLGIDARFSATAGEAGLIPEWRTR